MTLWPLHDKTILDASTFEWTYYWRRRSLRAATVLAALPVLLTLVVAGVKMLDSEWIHIDRRGVDILPWLFAIFYLRLLMFVLPFISSTTLISREAESGALPFLLVRPLSRHALLLGKFVGSWWTLCALCCGSYLVTTIVLVAADGFADSREILLATPAYLITLCVGTLAHAAFFTLVGLVARRPAFVGLVAILWENLIGYLPGLIRNFTIRFHLTAFIPDLGVPSAWLGTTERAPLLDALGWLILGTAGALAISAFVFGRRDYT